MYNKLMNPQSGLPALYFSTRRVKGEYSFHWKSFGRLILNRHILRDIVYGKSVFTDTKYSVNSPNKQHTPARCDIRVFLLTYQITESFVDYASFLGQCE